MQPRSRKISRPDLVGHFGDDFLHVALLASGLNVLLVVHGPEPVFVIAVGLVHAGERRAVAAMAGCAAEILGVVDLQQFLIRVAGENLIAAHGRSRQHHRLARSQMAGFAAVHQVDVFDVDLADADVEAGERRRHGIEHHGAGVGDPVGKVLVALLAQSVRLGQHLHVLLQQLGLLILPVLKLLVHVVELHDARLVGAGQLDLVGLGLQLVDPFPQRFLIALALGDLGLIGQRADVAAHFLKGIVEGLNLGSEVVYLALDSGSFGQRGLLGRAHGGVELLILRRCFDLLFVLRLGGPQVVNVARIELLESRLVGLPGADAVHLIVQAPHHGEHQHRRPDEQRLTQ